MINEYNARQYCSEDISKIENYDKAAADQSNVWECHHRGEVLPCGIYSMEDLEKHGLYKNRPASELIFLTVEQHNSLHKTNPSDATRAKLRKAKGGKNNPNYGRCGNKHPMFGKHHSAETKAHVSQKMSLLHWYNNGKVCVRKEECPAGFVKGRLKTR